MHIHVDELDTKAKEIIQDVKDKEIRSPAWIWMACGAFIGLMASCIKKPIVKPIVGTYTKV